MCTGEGTRFIAVSRLPDPVAELADRGRNVGRIFQKVKSFFAGVEQSVVPAQNDYPGRRSIPYKLKNVFRSHAQPFVSPGVRAYRAALPV